MKIDDRRLLSDLYLMTILFKHSPSKSMIENNAEYFDTCNEIYGDLTLSMFDSNKIFLNNNEKDRMIFDHYKKMYAKLVKYLFDNIEQIKTIFNNVDNFMDEINFVSYGFFDVPKKFNEKMAKDIILSFYSKIGDKEYNIVKRYFDENRIETGYEMDAEDDTVAFYTYMPIIKSGYIVSSRGKFNTVSMTDLTHELGHAIDVETFIFNQDKKLDYINDLLSEVPSTTYELLFLQYLIDNNIDAIGARIIENYKFNYLAGLSSTLHEFSEADSVYIDQDGYFIFDGKNELAYDIRTGLLYGLGYYFANHLVNIYENDPNEFKRVLNNLTTSRRENPNISDSIKNLGLDEEEFLSGDLIKNRIIINQGVLKMKYPYFGG